jgi:integrase
LLAKRVAPSTAKQAAKRAAKLASADTFEAVAREWIDKQHRSHAPRYSALLLARLESDIFPEIGSKPVANVEAPEVLDALRKVEKRGAIETARRLRQICSQVFRYAIVTGRAKYDPATVLRGALGSPGRPRGHKAMALGEVPNFLNALRAYDGDPQTRVALRLMVLTFARTTELRGAC